jgi:hypothetical protein
MRSRLVILSAVMPLFVAGAAFAQQQGPSTSRTPYVVPTAPGVITKSIFTVGTKDYIGGVNVDVAADIVGGYRMSGIPDGLGAFDNGDGTFTLLANHELGATAGVARAHGQAGAFVSKWVINKNTLAVQSGGDLITSVVDASTGSSITGSAAAFARFCSADLPAQSAFQFGGLGTSERIFMNGEESGSEGRAVATVVSTGTAYVLPKLGRFSWENSVANPFPQAKTIVAGLDDSGGGQVYFYVGTKTNTGSAVQRAGLDNGVTYGFKIDGVPAETRGSGLASSGPIVKQANFSMVNLGDASTYASGAALETASVNNGVLGLARPEDGQWDPSNPNRFFFVTTDNVTSGGGRSRLWQMDFNDIANPQNGGSINMLLEGTEGHEMLDNMTVVKGSGDGKTRVLLQEDVGNNARTGRIWVYNVDDKALTPIAIHDTARWPDGSAAANGIFASRNNAGVNTFDRSDEESSGIIPAPFLGEGWFLLDVQAHYTGGDLAALGLTASDVEGGQLLAMYVPQTIPEPATLGLAAAAGMGLLARRSRRKIA